MEPRKKKLDGYMAVFNCHLNNANERAAKEFVDKYGLSIWTREIQPIIDCGVMSIFQQGPNEWTQFYVDTVTRIVNEDRESEDDSTLAFKRAAIKSMEESEVKTDNSEKNNGGRAMSGHTKGQEAVGASGGSVTQIAWCNSPLGSAIIAEAFNVADETGRTPAQLAAERAELVAALEGAEMILANLDTIRHLDKSFGGLDQLRAILAKVKGPVPS